MNRRFQRAGHRKKKTKVPKGYDSKFEFDLSKILKGCTYHTEKIPYTSSHTYEPDFIPKTCKDVLIEAKGRFRDSREARKYISVQESNPEKKVVFIFYNPNTPMPGSRVRKKCGTKMTHAEWADKHGFEWYTMDTIPNKWRK